MNSKIKPILFAIAAAVFYALNMPFSKLLLDGVGSTMLAGLLYVGAGVGTGLLYICRSRRIPPSEKLARDDLLYTVLMVVLDIAAPIFLMLGLKSASAANASLLNNFEIVATTIIARLIFSERVASRLWGAIGLITLSSAILSFEDISSFSFSWGSLLILAAATCWGLENNCTRKLSEKNALEIVMIKGIFSGFGSVIIAFLVGERLPDVKLTGAAFLLGFVAYGLSITFYVMAQKSLGASKTSAYYAAAPFVGTFLSAVILKESLSAQYFMALGVMLAGSALVVYDTLKGESK